VLRGFSRVRIQGGDAARAGDFAQCVGATDVISEGSGTVLIGGMPAARRLDACVHGGRIMEGAATVLIGGPAVSPPGLAEIVANAKEIDRLRRRQAERRKARKNADDYLKQQAKEKAKGDGRKLAEDQAKKAIGEVVKKILEKSFGETPGLPPGASDFTEQEAEGARKAREWRDRLDQGIARDEERIRQLEKENADRAAGKPVTKVPPHPDLDKPIPGPEKGQGEEGT